MATKSTALEISRLTRTEQQAKRRRADRKAIAKKEAKLEGPGQKTGRLSKTAKGKTLVTSRKKLNRFEQKAKKARAEKAIEAKKQ